MRSFVLGAGLHHKFWIEVCNLIGAHPKLNLHQPLGFVAQLKTPTAMCAEPDEMEFSAYLLPQHSRLTSEPARIVRAWVRLCCVHTAHCFPATPIAPVPTLATHCFPLTEVQMRSGFPLNIKTNCKFCTAGQKQSLRCFPPEAQLCSSGKGVPVWWKGQNRHLPFCKKKQTAFTFSLFVSGVEEVSWTSMQELFVFWTLQWASNVQLCSCARLQNVHKTLLRSLGLQLKKQKTACYYWIIVSNDL